MTTPSRKRVTTVFDDDDDDDDDGYVDIDHSEVGHDVPEGVTLDADEEAAPGPDANTADRGPANTSNNNSGDSSTTSVRGPGHRPAFGVKNVYYLRVGRWRVMQFVLLMRSADVPWFSDLMLQKVLSAIEPLIVPKMEKEQAAKEKGLADVYRCDEFQLAYYVKPCDGRHSVVVRTPAAVAAVAPTAAVESAKIPSVAREVYEGHVVHGQALWAAVEPRRRGALTHAASTPWAGTLPLPVFPGVKYGRDGQLTAA
ncbi:hypothetical protein HK405_015506 [Cladochytrium tenue]|nr:hypothetical protein HK405_015506 [Cladochytrium tenue]